MPRLLPRWTALATLVLLLSACGDECEPDHAAPAWPQVAPEQIAEAERLGVPVAFNNDVGMRFVLIPSGTFWMGSPVDEEGHDDDEIQAEVTIAKPYYIQATEVTNAQYRRWRADHSSGEYEFLPTTNSDSRSAAMSLDGEHQPVAFVSWRDAQGFARWLQQREEGRAYALPTEAQWEYACRAGTASAYSWGESEPDGQRRLNGLDAATIGLLHSGAGQPDLGYEKHWPGDDGFRVSAPVGSFAPNAWGVHDMHGNVWEWCEDVYRDPTEGDPALLRDREGLLEHVIRGGGWLCPPWMLRSAHRFGVDSTYKEGEIGFRLVSPISESEGSGR